MAIEGNPELEQFSAELFSDDTPVETPPAPQEEAPVEEAAEESEQPEEQPVEETQEQKDERSANRFTKQTRELRETKRLVADLQAKLEAMNKPVEEKPLTPAPEAAKDTPASSPPDPSKYQYGELDPQFIRDTARHEAKIEMQALREAMRQEQDALQRDAVAQREVAELQTKAATIEQAGAAKFSDFNDVVVEGAKAGEWTLTKEMFELAAETTVAPDILYHLARNPAEAEQVAAMPARQQALWFGRMEAKMATPTPAPVKAATKAPPPTSAARGSSGRNTVAPDTDDFKAFKKMLFSDQ